MHIAQTRLVWRKKIKEIKKIYKYARPDKSMNPCFFLGLFIPKLFHFNTIPNFNQYHLESFDDMMLMYLTQKKSSIIVIKWTFDLRWKNPKPFSLKVQDTYCTIYDIVLSFYFKHENTLLNKISIFLNQAQDESCAKWLRILGLLEFLGLPCSRRNL